MAEIVQGEIWWGEQPTEKLRPYLILTRQRAIDALQSVSVAPITSRARGLASEMPLGSADGIASASLRTFGER